MEDSNEQTFVESLLSSYHSMKLIDIINSSGGDVCE